MTVTEAANRLKLTRQGVNFLITTKQIRAKKVPTAVGWYWDIPEAEILKREGAEKLSRDQARGRA